MYRMVTKQGAKEYISTVILSDEEAREHLAIELEMHKTAGWEILDYLAFHSFVALSPKGKLREVSIRQYHSLPTPGDTNVED